jgi:hypothetical protein
MMLPAKVIDEGCFGDFQSDSCGRKHGMLEGIQKERKEPGVIQRVA